MASGIEQLWDEFRLPLLRFIRRRVADDASAEDIVQDLFLKVHTRIDTLRDNDKLEAWLYQLARNAIVDYYRRVKPTTDLSGDIPSIENEPEANIVEDLLPAVRRMVDQLPPIYREALTLTEDQGLTQKELAERLGLSVSGAKSRVQRARQQLKQMLLDCCHFELDRRNAIIAYHPRCACCANGRCEPSCRV